jgi:polyisoprenoid-binding protein YceI
MRKFNTLILFLLILTSCRKSLPESNQLVLEKDTINEYLIKSAQKDIVRSQDATFDIINQNVPENRYVVDTTHSSVQFRVKHWGIYDVIGRIESYEIVLYYDKVDFTDMVVEARINPQSINMPNKGMENHLKDDKFGFFEVSKFPTVIFKSHKMEIMGDSLYKLTGNMTIKQITKEVVFNVKFNGFAYAPNHTTPGFTINGAFNRLDFKLGNKELLPGNQLPMIGHYVYITSNIRLISDYD